MQLTSTLISLAAVAGVALAQTNSFSVATPQSLQQCVPYQIAITGGTPPFNIRITKPMETSQIIENLPQTSDRTVTWTCNVASGQMITILVVDSTGAMAPSAPSNSISANSDSSCLGQSASISSGSSSGSSTSASSGSSSSSSPSSSTAAATTSKTSSSGSSSTTSSAPASSSSSASNGAMTLTGASAAVAGAVGALVAALL